MSTWTFKASILGALLTVSACTEGVPVGLGAGGLAFNRAAPERIEVTGDAVVITGPPGYCVDETSTRDDGSTAFVLLGSCAAIARDASVETPDVPAILTVTVSEVVFDEGDLPVETLEAFFETEAGRVALSRSGDASAVRVLESVNVDDALLYYVEDSGTRGQAAILDRYWRAIFDLDGRLMSATVVGIVARPLSRGAGLSTLESFTSILRIENDSRAVGKDA